MLLPSTLLIIAYFIDLAVCRNVPSWNTTKPDQNINASAGLPLLANAVYTVMNATIINQENDVEPSPNGTWNHGPMMSYYNNLYYISWYNSPRDEAHFQRVLCKTSIDSKEWMEYPIQLFPNITQYPGVYNMPFFEINNRFYASASVKINDNSVINNKGYVQLIRLITYINNINDYNMSQIFWLTSKVPAGYENLGYKTYLEMSHEIISDMAIYFNSLITENVDSVSTNDGIVIFNQTTSMYLLPPETENDYLEIMLLLRAFPIDDLNLFASSCKVSKSQYNIDNIFNLNGICRPGTQMFVNLFDINYNLNNSLNHTQYQNICNWTQPVITSIPDAPSRTCIANLPQNNGYYLVGNQIGNTQYEDRKVLTLAITDKSGLYFNSVYAIRFNPPPLKYPGNGKMPEFAYPGAIIQDNNLYICYDVNKEDIQISVINLVQLT